MHITCFILSGLAAVAAAKDVAFSIFATGNNTEFFDMPISAVEGGFWVNRHTKQYCPPNVGSSCVNGTRTVIHGSDKKDGQISLGSMVPGGQDIFIAKDGRLGYTKAHSSVVPADAIRNPKGFTYERPKGKFVDVGRLTFTKGTFYLCGPEDTTLPTYQIYLDTKKTKMSIDCAEIEIGTRLDYSKDKVWQYE